MNTTPTHQSKSIDDGTSSLLPDDDSKEFNNNPNYRPNMIEVLNTPFDHIERIVLQDFSDTLFKDGENYFKGLFKFPSSLYWSLKNITDNSPVVDFVWNSSQGKWVSGNKSIKEATSGSNTFEYYEGTALKATWSGFDSIQSITNKQYRFFSSDDFHGGFSGFTMRDPEGVSGDNYASVSDKFGSDNYNNAKNGGFFVDSFTYTPFVDYSQVGEGGDPRVGVYSDQFLTDYNTEKYDVVDNQIDKNRHKMSSKLYELGNLKKDLEDAKVAFRNAITYIDGQEQKTYQVYIYTLCEHLAELFAKLSNIRMSHEIYGFKHPHCQWEGILALDVWYNLLYREIDAKYPFNDNYLNMNPMQRRPLCIEKGENQVEHRYVLMDNDRKLYLLEDKTCSWTKDASDIDDGLEWMEDETFDEFVYIWDSNLWAEYYNNSQKITDTRKKCTTPRGVLAKVYRIVKGLEYKWETYLAQRDSDEDYMWFKQPGKVYSHWDKWDESNKYTKYVNLHLGRAYDVMSGREYFDLTTWGRTGA